VVLDKDPCSVLPSDYDLFINLSRHAIPRDKVRTTASARDRSVLFTSLLPFVSSYLIVGEKQEHKLKCWLMNSINNLLESFCVPGAALRVKDPT